MVQHAVGERVLSRVLLYCHAIIFRSSLLKSGSIVFPLPALRWQKELNHADYMLPTRARVTPRVALHSVRLRRLSAVSQADGHVIGVESGKLSAAGAAIDAQIGGKLSNLLRYVDVILSYSRTQGAQALKAWRLCLLSWFARQVSSPRSGIDPSGTPPRSARDQ